MLKKKGIEFLERWWSLLNLIKVVITQELALSSFLRTYKKGEHKKLIIDDKQFEVLKCIEMVLPR